MSEITVLEARENYFRENGFPEDGGYEDKWVPLKFGFLTFYIYNSQSRKKAVKLHDIHHVITGYKSTPRGEAEISAWELAAGVHDKHFARLINLGGLFYGAYIYPATTFKAYHRGKHSKTLYKQEFSESLLEEKVKSLRERLLPEEPIVVKVSDCIQYILLVIFLSLPIFVLFTLGIKLLVSR